jgi:hypothetical protein
VAGSLKWLKEKKKEKDSSNVLAYVIEKSRTSFRLGWIKCSAFSVSYLPLVPFSSGLASPLGSLFFKDTSAGLLSSLARRKVSLCELSSDCMWPDHMRLWVLEGSFCPPVLGSLSSSWKWRQ